MVTIKKSTDNYNRFKVTDLTADLEAADKDTTSVQYCSMCEVPMQPWTGGRIVCMQCGLSLDNANASDVTTKKTNTIRPNINIEGIHEDKPVFKSIRYNDNNKTSNKPFNPDESDDRMYESQGFEIVSTVITSPDGRVSYRK